MKMRFLIRTTMLLLAVCAVLLSNAVAGDGDEIVGVWLTVDASDDEGRAQGGLYFRSDGTGGFIDISFKAQIVGDDKEAAELANRLIETMGFAREGHADATFSYEVKDAQVTIDIVTFKGIKADSDLITFDWRISDNNLRMTFADEPLKWILLRRAE